MKVFIKSMAAILLMVASVLEMSAQADLRPLLPGTQSKRTEIIMKGSQVGNNRLARKKSAPSQGRSSVPHSKAADDTVYSIYSAHQFGWNIPRGLLTKEQARHRKQSYMFTGKNDKGHWTKMESVDARGRHMPGCLWPYIQTAGATNDTLFNHDWVHRLNKSCILEMIPDPTGENLIQEHAYDKDRNLIFAYSRTPIGNNQIIGFYKDNYGFPAQMREVEGYSYGSLVRVTEDKWGNDACIEYIDSKGVNMLNNDGAYALVSECNEYGDYLKTYSVDSKGNRVRDAWGNCGWIFTYTDNHQPKSVMFTDEDMKPMPMPLVERDMVSGVIKCVSRYDEYCRETEVIFVTDTDEPDTNIYGCHRVTYEYDSLGHQVRYTGYDLDGNLVPMIANDVAIYSAEYDSGGNLIRSEYFDAGGLPRSTPGYSCKTEYYYDEAGNYIGIKNWTNIDGVLTLDYCKQTDTIDCRCRKLEKWMDGLYRIIEYDEKGREVFTGDFDKNDGHTIFLENNFSYRTTEYIERAPGVTEYTETYYDEAGNPAPALDINRQIVVCDSVSRIKYFKQYRDDILMRTYRIKYDKDFNQILEQADNNTFGEIVRAGGAFGMRFYKARTRMTPSSGFSYFLSLDEFDEPDYIVDDNGSIYYYERYTKDGRQKMSIDNEVIDAGRNLDLNYELPKVMSVEVIDSIAYRLGIRDNDVILSFGSYQADLKEPMLTCDFKVDWTVRNAVEAGELRDMVVFRVEDGPAGKFYLDTIRGLVGAPSQLGFITHMRFLTQRQTDRIRSCWDDRSESRTGNTRHVIISYPEMFRKMRTWRYNSELIDPAVLLGVYDVQRGLKWDYRDETYSDELFNIELMSFRKDQIQTDRHCLFTKDGNHIIDFNIAKKEEYGIDLIDGRVDERIYEKLLGQYAEVADMIDKYSAGYSRIDPKLLCGYWVIEPQDSEEYNAEGFLCLNKDGTCVSEIRGLRYVPDLDPSPVVCLSRSLKGKWREVENFLSFLTDDEDSFSTIENIEIQHPTTPHVYETLDFFDKYLKYPDYLYVNSAPLSDLNDEAIVKYVDKHTLILEDNCGKWIKFRRQKGKPKVR